MNENNRRLAKNTIMLYIRMILIMIINLYMSRVVLKVLGVEDYGLYNVVGSIVLFLGFLNTSMAAASQRFLSYANVSSLLQKRNIFKSVIYVQLLIGFTILIVGEVLGNIYIENFLNVEIDKIFTAHIVFQFSLFSFFISTICVPFTACIISNEKMSAFSLLSVMEAALKLTVAFILPCFESNKLIAYSGLLFFSVIVVQTCYYIYCRNNFAECVFTGKSNRDTIIGLLRYSGWNLMGSFSGVCIEQGVNMILNVFFGIVVNAARGIAFQVSGAMSQLSGNFLQALNPQIVKSYASNDLNRMHQLIIQGTKLSFFLLYIGALPVIMSMYSILELWLTIVPNYSTVFCILVIISSLVSSLSQPLLMGAMATTNIKQYQIVVSLINFLNLPISILLLLVYPNPYVTVYVMIILSIISFIARLIFVKKMVFLPISLYLKNALIPIGLTTIVSVIVCIVISPFIPYNTISMLILRSLIFISTILCTITILGLNKQERYVIMKYFKSKIYVLSHRK